MGLYPEAPLIKSQLEAAPVAQLFDPLTLRSTTFRNRIFVSPMCQYSAQQGMPTDWHFVHLGSRAVGGAGLVMVEATAVSPEGRISLGDTGLWSEAHSDAYRRIAHFIRQQGAVPGIQLAHAGRKASVRVPWEGGAPLQPSEGAWQTLAPSPIPFAPSYPTPKALTEKEIEVVIEQFRSAARLAIRAGFEVVEIGETNLARTSAGLCSDFRDRLGGRGVEHRAIGATEPEAAPIRGRPDRLLQRGHSAEHQDPRRTRVPSAVRGADPEGSTGGHRRRWFDHRAAPSRGDHCFGASGGLLSGARRASGSLLAAARRSRSLRAGTLAEPIPASR